MLNFENIEEKFKKIVESEEWQSLQNKFNSAQTIFVLGHGGNMAVADHAAVDITRLSNGTKNAMCPGSCVVATSLINDVGFDQWMVAWLNQRTSAMSSTQLKKSLVLGVSSSGNSDDVIKAIEWANKAKIPTAMISGREVKTKLKDTSVVTLNTEYYHTAEVLTLLLSYELTHGSGNVCPAIGSNAPDDLKKLNWKGNKIRKHSYPDEQINLAIDFDGVIHKNSKGYYDGTIYDDPIPGSKEALRDLSAQYTIILHTCKAKPDRGLVNGKTGTEMIWDWLEKHDMADYVSKITSEKPRAVCYIDDKAIAFDGNWQTAIDEMRTKDIIR